MEIKKIYDPSKFFDKITIPETWNSLEEFVDWYIDSRMPMMIPWNSEVIVTDDATAVCLFRKPPYQVELYLILPGYVVPVHGHPGVEVITVSLGGGSTSPKIDNGVSRVWGYCSNKLTDGQEHGGEIMTKVGNGFVLLAFQKWKNIDDMSSAAIQWKGNTAGPLQEKLISKKKKNAYIIPGYADVSKLNNNEKES